VCSLYSCGHCAFLEVPGARPSMGRDSKISLSVKAKRRGSKTPTPSLSDAIKDAERSSISVAWRTRVPSALQDDAPIAVIQ
jgi:hypothetical protein